MNITYILGNGFDLNLGLKTSYRDFKRWYDQQDSDNVLVKDLKKDINVHSENWSDMELGFGKYTEKIKTVDDFKVVYSDLRDNLIKYIKTESEKLERDPKVASSTLYNCFMYPEYFIGNEDERVKFNSDPMLEVYKYVNILTLNYSYSIEKLMSGVSEQNLQRINLEHVHGTLDENLIFGVYNGEQVANKELLKDDLVLDYLIKNRYMETISSRYRMQIENVINNTNLLCIYGTSLGETDWYLWNMVNEWFMKNDQVKIIYYYVNKNDRINYKLEVPMLRRREKEYRDRFISRIGLPNDLSEEKKMNIIVSYNQNMFEIKY